MRRNRAPAVTITDEQRKKMDDAVLAVIRSYGRERAGVIMASPVVMDVLKELPEDKPDYRYVGEALQRLKTAGRIELVHGLWRTTSPTS
jgi:hypothetical protein